MDVYRSAVSRIIDPPYLIDQLLARIDLSGCSGQLIQQFELLERQRKRLCSSHYLISLSVQGDVAELDHLRGANPVSFQQGLDTGRHLQRIERFRQIIVRPEIEGLHFLPCFASRGQHKQRKIGIGSSELLA